MMKYIIALILYFFTATSISAQFYEFGQDPASLKWKQINTDHFKIIFPSDFAENGQNLASLMEKNYTINSHQLNHQPSKIPLIIHNQTVYSNAFVTWAPKRMEFFTFPDPDIYPIDWLEELSLHEYRHVIQIDKINQGFTHALSLILGQQATGVVAGMMPLWFIEGDAVSAETDLSSSGRGRLPSFEMGIKAQLLYDCKQFPLSKAYLGSYKDYVPDYYQLGYQMVSFARKQYGDDYWTNALDYVGSRPFLISPLYFYSKKNTGGGQRFLYKNTLAYLKSHWNNSLVQRNPEIFKPLNKRNTKVFSSYKHPVLLKDSSIIVLKEGLDITPRFVKLNLNGDEEILYKPGTLISECFSVYNSKIFWDEYVQDIRWTNRSYSVLKEFDIKTRKSRTLSKKTRYTSPAVSPGGDSIVAINTSADYKFSLVILNSEDGQLLLSIPSPDNSFLQYPEWVQGSDKIAVITVGESGKRIMIYDLQSKLWNEIYKTGYVNITQLKSEGNYLFFNASFSGIDEIYSLNLSDNQLSKLSNSEFGAFYPDVSIENRLLAYSSYGPKGYDIILKSFNPKLSKKFVIPDTITEQSFASVNLNSSNIVNREGDAEKVLYNERPYSKVSHLFNLHSWAPYWFNYMDPNIDDPQVSPGFTLLSQNQLSTAFTSLGYERRNGYNYFHSGFIYKGLIPVFDFSTTYGGISALASDTILTNPKPDLYSTLSTYIPLTLSSGRIITQIQPSFQFSYSSSFIYSSSENTYKSGGFLEPGLFFSSYLRTTARNLQPRLGLTLNGKISSAIFSKESAGNIRSLRLNLYLPGLLRNHGIKIKSEWQDQKSDLIYFQNQLTLPRGYAQNTLLKMDRYSIDYVFPVIYPDLSLEPFLYLKRIRGNFFFDYMKGIGSFVESGFTLDPVYLKSEGVELYADYHILRFIFELSSGIRFVYLPEEKKIGTQILFSVNLDKFL